MVGPSLGNDPNRILTFFSAMILTYFAVDVIKILLAKQLKKKLTSHRIRLIKKGLGVVLVICGVVLIIKGFLPMDHFNVQDGIERIKK